jgi:hypothetical protein
MPDGEPKRPPSGILLVQKKQIRKAGKENLIFPQLSTINYKLPSGA